MLDELEEVKYWSIKSIEFERHMNAAKLMRDFTMAIAAKAGNRHKDIGHVCGLSESRVKHIILEMRQTMESAE